MEGFRPGYLARYGLDYATVHKINPRLVYCSITGFGQKCHKPAHDLNVIGLAGLNSLDDIGRACVSEVQVSAIGSALNALSGVSMALLARERTGEGQHLDVNLYATALSMQVTGISSLWGCAATGDKPFGRTAHYYNIYRTQDGRYLTVGTIEPKFWQRFCELIKMPELVERQFDFAHEEVLEKQIASKIAEKTQAEWLELIGDEEFCVTPVCSLDEALESQLTVQEELLQEQESDLGMLRYIGGPVKFSESQNKISRRAPFLGEHTQAILQELGYSKEEIVDLTKEKQFRRDEESMKRLFKLLTTVVMVLTLFVVAKPVQAGLISQEQEIEMGHETAMALEAKYGLSQDPYLQERVDRIGQRLAAVSGRNDIKYSLRF